AAPSCHAYTASPELYTLSLHDALPICGFPERDLHPYPLPQPEQYQDLPGEQAELYPELGYAGDEEDARWWRFDPRVEWLIDTLRSEEHTSELQSRENLVCRLLLEKKKS